MANNGLEHVQFCLELRFGNDFPNYDNALVLRTEVFDNETDALTFFESMNDKKAFLIVDSITDELVTALEPFKQIDSIFLFAPTPPPRIPSRVATCCSDEITLISELKQAVSQLQKQMAAFSVYNQAEKATRDLSRETGSFLFFQLFKSVLLGMTKTPQAKEMMISKCRDYYRGNDKELENIAEFDLTYKSSEAIPWYTKESFVYKLINKALRTEDVDALYHFRYYIVDLCIELEKSFNELKEKQGDSIIRLYRGFKTSRTEIANFERNIGNLISTNGYLSTSQNRKVAYEFATKPVNRPNCEKILFEYSVDLSTIKKVVIADIAKYSAFPEEAEVLFDLGASFQIESCTYSADEDLWFVNVSASDKGAEAAAEYIAYQKAKVAESNMILMFGHLLVEMGEYVKAEKYFQAILRTSNPNDEEIACIYNNMGRAHRLKGEYEQALANLKRSYETHAEARPPRLMSAAKTMNAIGIVCMEQGDVEQARDWFERALKLYRKTVSPRHPDIGGTLINLGNIHCQEGRFREALACFTRAQKIFERSLPANHPNVALALNNLANLHYRQKEYDLALDSFQKALAMKEKVLPPDHPDLVRTVHNLAVIYAIRGENDQADLFFKRAAGCALPEIHPFMQMLKTNTLSWKTAMEKNQPTTDIKLIDEDNYLIEYF